jgi:hypothetical protein
MQAFEQPLSVDDHTELVNLALHMPLPILAKLASDDGAPFKRDTPLSSPLRAFAQSSLGTSRQRIVATRVHELAERMRFAIDAPSDELRGILTEIDDAFERAESVEDVIPVLEALRDRSGVGDIAQTGLQTGIDFLAYGLDTIYSPHHPYYRTLAEIDFERNAASPPRNVRVVYSQKTKSAVDDAKEIGKADVAGAVIGAGAGSVAGGVGAGPGALAFGVTASFTKSVINVVEAIWSWFD